MGTEPKQEKATLYYMNVGTDEKPHWVPIGQMGHITIGHKRTMWTRIKTALMKVKRMWSGL